jgi:hypothetical protein
VIGGIALSGIGVAGAALLPGSGLPGLDDGRLTLVARGEVRFVGESLLRYSDAHGATCPASLDELRKAGYIMSAPVDPWGEPLLFGCVEGPRAFVILSKGHDREVGTDDDVLFTSP